MSEFAFELALCAFLERARGGIVSRQLGASAGGNRVVDTVHVAPGPEFEDRVRLTPEAIPVPAIEADVGPGTAKPPTEVFDTRPDRARDLAERCVEIGFFEREHRDSAPAVRQAARYPDWFGAVTGIENKPDLGTPGALETQLRTDVSLAVLDYAVLATGSYVTGAHLNRIPEAVGVWRFDPQTGEREVVREPKRLPTGEPGFEIADRHTAQTEIRPVTAEEKRTVRLRIAERAYGKGWRTYELPACANARAAERCGAGGLPGCAWKGGLVHPAVECGPDCPGFEPGAAPEHDVEGERARRTAWDPDPPGAARRQSGLDRFL